MRLVDGLMTVAVLAGLVALAAWFAPPTDQASGQAHVIDGDTLRLQGQTIRLAGLDAPELQQSCQTHGRPYACGEVARAELIRLTAGRHVTCDLQGRDRYARRLALCRIDGEDVARALVRRGLAVAYGRYEAEEAEARARSAGLWAGEFQRPSEWRRQHLASPPSRLGAI